MKLKYFRSRKREREGLLRKSNITNIVIFYCYTNRIIKSYYTYFSYTTTRTLGGHEQ